MLYYPHMDWRYEDIFFGRNFNDLFCFLFAKAPRKVKKLVDSIYDHFDQREPFEMDIPCNYEGFKFFNVKFYPDERAEGIFYLEAGFKYGKEDKPNKVISMEEIRKNLENKEDYRWRIMMT